jgi:hypothetical protein
MSEVERRLRSALVPVDPPGSLTDSLEEALAELTQAAADELAGWEPATMRDPRNWIRPVAAVVIGGAAAGGLVVVRARQQHRRRGGRGLRALERSARDVSGQIRRRLKR